MATAPVVTRRGPNVNLKATGELIGFASYDERAEGWLVHDSTGAELPGRWTWFELEKELPERFAAQKGSTVDRAERTCGCGMDLGPDGRCGPCDDSSAADGRWHQDRTPLGESITEWAARPLPVAPTADNDWLGAFDGFPDFGRNS